MEDGGGAAGVIDMSETYVLLENTQQRREITHD